MSIWTDKAGRRHVGVMLNGKRVHRILPQGTSASAAKQVEGSLRAALGARRAPRIPGDPLLAEVMALYLKHAEGLRSPETAKFHALRIGPWIDGRRASETRQVAAELVQDMTGHYAAATINRSLGALSKALRIAWKLDRVPYDYSGGMAGYTHFVTDVYPASVGQWAGDVPLLTGLWHVSIRDPRAKGHTVEGLGNCYATIGYMADHGARIVLTCASWSVER